MKHFALLLGGFGRIAFVFGVTLISTRGADACGLDWLPPAYHFEAVDYAGHFDKWWRIARIHNVEGRDIPIFVGFNSARQGMSALLGLGWSLPIFESHVVQTSADEFLMMTPDGQTERLIRDSSDRRRLIGSGGWAVSIEGDTMTAYASCGWKIVFVRGSIQSFVGPSGASYVCRIAGDGHRQLLKGDRVLVEFGRDGLDDSQLVLKVEGYKVKLGKVQRPVIADVAGVPVITGYAQALGVVQSEDVELKLEYEAGPELKPGIQIREDNNSPRRVTWDRNTKCVQADGVWKYSTTSAPNFPAITRVNENGTEEKWAIDQIKGITAIRNLGGPEIRTYRFASGKMSGRIRKVEEVSEGKVSVTMARNYDDLGRLIRQTDAAGDDCSTVRNCN
jgi:hypothetical protein